MASPETIGTMACRNCGNTAYVKKNRGGLPYYRCGSCDSENREHSQRGARIFMQNVTMYEPERAATEPETDKPEPVKAGKKPEPKKPAPGTVASFLFGG